MEPPYKTIEVAAYSDLARSHGGFLLGVRPLVSHLVENAPVRRVVGRQALPQPARVLAGHDVDDPGFQTDQTGFPVLEALVAGPLGQIHVADPVAVIALDNPTARRAPSTLTAMESPLMRSEAVQD